jgi:integrase
MPRVAKPFFKASRDTWYVSVSGRKLSLGVHGRGNRAAAYAEWHQLLANGKPATTGTVAGVISAYLDDASCRLKPHTVKVYRWFLTPFARKLGHLQLGDLSPVIAESYSRKPSWSATTRGAFLTVLTTCFRWAVRARLVASNPLQAVQKPRRAGRVRPLVLIDPDSHARLLAAANPRFRLFLIVLHATGARPSEVARITAADLHGDIVRLKEHKTARLGHQRTIYLTPAVAALLRGLAAERPRGALLRTGSGSPWVQNTWRGAMVATRARAGVPHATCYGYRHSFATDALAAGVPESLAAELLGHKGTAMLHRHYSHLATRVAELRASAARVR